MKVMKIFCNKELLLEIDDYMIDVIAFFEERESSKVRLKNRIKSQAEAHARSFMNKFRKFWEPLVGDKDLSDKDFVAFVMKREGYMDFTAKSEKARKQTEILHERRMKEVAEMREAKKEASKRSMTEHNKSKKKKPSQKN